MSIDFPRAWQIAEHSKAEDHHPECSYRVTEGCILCDCNIIHEHPDYLSEVFYTADGIPYNELEYIESRIGCKRYLQ